MLNAIHNAFNDPRLRRVFLLARLPIAFLLGVALLTHVREEWFLPGLIVSAIGELLQLWCFASIKTGKVLASEGPYMFLRNPMYLARFILLFGMLLWSGRLWVVALFTILYYFYMVNRVRREEEKLAQVFGEDYLRYTATVNRFLPSLRAVRSQSLWPCRWEYLARNHGLWNLLAVLCVYAFFYAFTFLCNRCGLT